MKGGLDDSVTSIMNLKASSKVGIGNKSFASGSNLLDHTSPQEEHLSAISYESRVANIPANKEFKEILFFPDNDIDVRMFPRENVVVHAAQEDLASAKGYVVSCLRRYCSPNWVTVVATNDHFDGKSLTPKVEPVDAPPQNDVTSVVQVKEALDPALLGPVDGIKVKAIAKDSTSQQTLFSSCILPSGPSDPRVDVPPPGNASKSNVKIQALVHVKEVKWLVKQLEPLFLSVAVFNVRKRERITETMHLHVNPEEVNLILGARISNLAKELVSRKALFPLDDLSPDMYLVFFLEKTLRASDVDHTVDEQMKHGTLKPRPQAKAEDDIRMSAVRLADYRQPFAWTARCLFEKGRSIIGTDIVVDGFTRFKQGFTVNDAQLLAHLEKMQERASKGATTSRGRGDTIDAKRMVPVSLLIDFELVDAEKPVLNVWTPSLEGNIRCSPAESVRMAQQFSSPDNVVEPSREVVNDFYVFLDWANMIKAGRRVRNICIRVSLHDSDQSLGTPGLPVMYGRYNKLDQDYLCSVQYHEKKLSLYEQIKIRLPSVLHAGHHLLFTFSHVQCRVSKMKKGDEIETVFGYATFSLFADKRVVQDGSYQLPVANVTSFPKSRYLDEQQEQTIEYLDNKHPVFGFHTKLVSTIYTQDPSLDQWFRTPIAPSSASCAKLVDAAPYAKIQFMHIIMDRLWEVMCVGTSQEADAALVQAALLCDNITHAAQRGVRSSLIGTDFTRNESLVQYVHYEYDEDFSSFEGVARSRPKPLYLVLMESIYNTSRNNPTVVSYMWFFFDVCIKSLTINLNAQKALSQGGPVSRASRVDANFQAAAAKVFEYFGRQIRAKVFPLAPIINTEIALFLKDLLSLVDRGWCMDVLFHYLEIIKGDDKQFAGLLWRTLRIVSDHPHFVPLNLPIPKKIGATSSIVPSFERNHFLIGLMLRYLSRALTSGDKQIRQYAFTVVREAMRKHDHDTRYAGSKVKKRIARMYFPIVLVLSDRLEAIEQFDVTEQREWLVILLWVLRHSNRKTVLQKWWITDTVKSLKSFMRLLQLAVVAFGSVPNMISQVTLIALHIVIPFMKDMQAKLRLKENKGLMDELFAVFQKLLSLNIRDADVLNVLFHALRLFILSFPEPLFVFPDTSTYCGDLSFQLLQYANVANGKVRAASSALMYLLMRSNFAARGNFARMKLQATVAVSRFTGDTTMKQTALLETALEAVANRALQEFGGDSFSAQVQQLSKTLFRVIRDSAKIQEYKLDRERMCDYMMKVSLGYATDSPDLRVTWLNNLADYHLVSQNYEEHAQCKLMIAALVCQYLHQRDPELAKRTGVPSSWEAFVNISPNVMQQPALQEFNEDSKEEGMYESRQFSLLGLQDLLKEVLLSLRHGMRYEMAVEVYDILVTLMQYQRKYDLMAFAFGEMSTLTKQLIDAETSGSRSFSAYYRVAFYGERWGADLDGTTYIYKRDEFSHIADVTSQLETQFKTSFPKVVRLGNAEVKKETLEKDTCYWQIAAVKEHFEDANKDKDGSGSLARTNTSTGLERTSTEIGITKIKRLNELQMPTRRGSLLVMDATGLAGAAAASKSSTNVVAEAEKRVTRWERKFNVRKFLLEQPFSKTGGSAQSEGRPELQWKRKTIYTVEFAFPYVNTRALVVNEETKELTPIETAIEQIDEQTAAFRAETSRTPPNLNALQRVATGSILTQVNVGVLHTARVFLKEPLVKDIPRAKVKLLVVSLQNFLAEAQKAITLNGMLIGSEQIQLQNAFEEAYAKMNTEMSQLFEKVI